MSALIDKLNSRGAEMTRFDRDEDWLQLERFSQFFTELAEETDNSKLVRAVVSKALELTGADAGLLYLQPVSGLLSCESVRILSSDLFLSGEELTDSLSLIPIPEQMASKSSCLLRAYLEKRSLLVDDPSVCAVELDEMRQFERAFAYRVDALLSVPLGGLQDKVYGVLQLMNPGSENFSGQRRVLVEQLASIAGSLLYKNQQLEEQKTLFESMIQMIAGAVDEKFYLGADHCRRVPVLAMMLARAVNRTERPPFAEQVFDQGELYELEVAAWLHDCGKLVTPISLVDKSSKLETVFDRIELIQTRFEILRRDQELFRLREGLSGENLPVLTDGSYRQQKMLEDMHFLAACNHGKRIMTADDLQRLRDIADRYRWVDRQMEEVSVLTEDELTNLSIMSGTLNERERVKINNHALASIGMLDLLPFPDDLRRVPDIISGYHQSGDAQPLLQARILAIADRFVSVTAENRAYCKTNSLENAMKILYGMADSGQLDRNLLDLFSGEHLHKQYAAEFLSDDQ